MSNPGSTAETLPDILAATDARYDPRYIHQDGTGLPASIVSDASVTGGSSDAVIYVSKYFASALWTSKTAALQAAHDALPPNGGILYLPIGAHTLDNVSFTKPVSLIGSGEGTQLLPGSSGTIFTSTYGFNGATFLSDLTIGELQGQTSPSRNPATPLIIYKSWSGFVGITRVQARLRDTGTLFRFDGSSNVSFRDSHLYVGAYALAFEIANLTGVAFQADTISFKNTMVEGLHFAIVRPESGSFTFNWHTDKQYWNTTYAFLDHSLAVDATAGQPSITLQTGQGASWNIGDPIFIDDDAAIDTGAGGRTGRVAEINRVTGVTGDVISLAQPLQNNHGTNGNTFHCQVLRGGVCLSISSNVFVAGSQHLHVEQSAIGILDHGSRGTEWHNNTYTANRFYRAVGNVQDVIIGRTLSQPRGNGETENMIIDIPPFNIPNVNADRFKLLGPWLMNMPNILENGVATPLSSFVPGPFFQNKFYEMWDGATFRAHAPAGSGAVPYRTVGFGVRAEHMEEHYDGTLWLNDGTYQGAIGDADKIRMIRNNTLGRVRESFDRTVGATGTTNGAGGVATGVMFGAVLEVFFEDSFTKITTWIRNSATLGTALDSHWWLALFDQGSNLIAQTADQGTTAVSASSGARTPLPLGNYSGGIWTALATPYTPAGNGYVFAVAMFYLGTGGVPVMPGLGASACISGPLATGALNHGIWSGGAAQSAAQAPPTLGAPIHELIVSGGATGILPYFALFP